MKRGIVLLNLGSPDSTEVKDVRKYLMEFLMDERVIDYPYIFRVLLVGGIIVPFRAPKSAEAYKSVWTKDGSPLVVISKQQQAALQKEVEEPVELAMRYRNPTMKSAFDNLVQQSPDIEEVLAIPLYPHYAMSSYETAVEHAKTVHKKNKYPFKLSFIKPFYNEDNYIEAITELMRPYIQQDYDQILFSYHGLPQRHMTKADPTNSHCMKVPNCCEVASVAHKTCYRHQCWTTTQIIANNLNIPQEKIGFSFQSRLGREEWLKPYTALRFEEVPKEGVKKLLVVCPAFVSDCLETLEEIAVEGKESFLHSGGESFTFIPCLNTQPLWIKTLATWVKDFSEGKTEMLLQDENDEQIHYFSSNIFIMRILYAAIVLGIAAIICFLIFGSAFRYKSKSTETIVVTGLAEKDFISDLIVWSGDYSRKSLNLKEAYSTLKQDENVIRQYLKGKGIADGEMVFYAVEINKEFNHRTDMDGRSLGQEFSGYNLSQRVKVESKDVSKVEKISREVTELIESSIEFNSSPPLYYYSKLSDIKINLLAKASADAKARAQTIAENSGSSLGDLKKANMGIFQITGKNSNEEFSYGGTFNTRDKIKTGSITIKMEFAAD